MSSEATQSPKSPSPQQAETVSESTEEKTTSEQEVQKPTETEQKVKKVLKEVTEKETGEVVEEEVVFTEEEERCICAVEKRLAELRPGNAEMLCASVAQELLMDNPLKAAEMVKGTGVYPWSGKLPQEWREFVVWALRTRQTVAWGSSELLAKIVFKALVRAALLEVIGGSVRG